MSCRPMVGKQHVDEKPARGISYQSGASMCRIANKLAHLCNPSCSGSACDGRCPHHFRTMPPRHSASRTAQGGYGHYSKQPPPDIPMSRASRPMHDAFVMANGDL